MLEFQMTASQIFGLIRYSIVASPILPDDVVEWMSLKVLPGLRIDRGCLLRCDFQIAILKSSNCQSHEYFRRYFFNSNGRE